MLDGVEPGSFEYAIDRAPPGLEAFALSPPDGPALALWLGGRAKDHCEGVPVDVRLKTALRQATACDPMNGVTQTLSVSPRGDGAGLKGLLVRDWPLLIRWEPAGK